MFVAPPVRIAPSLGVKRATRAATEDDRCRCGRDAEATPAPQSLAADQRKKTEDLRAGARAAAPKVGETVVVGRRAGGEVSLVAANGWCQVTYDEECEARRRRCSAPTSCARRRLAETMKVSDFDEVLIKWGFKEALGPLRLCVIGRPTQETHRCRSTR